MLRPIKYAEAGAAGHGGDAGIVENYISYLRRKVDREEPKLIHTVRGVGYSLRLPRG